MTQPALPSVIPSPSLIDELPVAIAICNAEAICYANSACLALWRASRQEEINAHPAVKDLHQELYTLFQQEGDVSKRKKTTRKVQRTITRLDGTAIAVELNIRLLNQQDQEWLLVTFSDVSDRLDTQQALHRKAVQLQVAAEVARDAIAAPNLDELLNLAVTLVRERFNFYHAGIFLVDDDQEYAVLAAATGEAGQKMIAQGHKLAVGKVGLVGYVAGSGKPRIALDVGEDAIHFKQPMLPDTRSEMALPLTVDGRVIGVLDVQSTEEAAFDDEDVQVLQTMADQLAMAIDKARLLCEAEQRAHHLAFFYETALATGSALETDILLQRLYEQVQQMLAPDSFVVAFFHEEQQQLEIKIARELGKPVDSLEGKRLPVTEGGLTGWVVRQRRSLIVNDLKEDTLPVRPIFTADDNHKMRTWMGVPLIVGDRLLGAVSVQSLRPRAFSTDQQKFFETLVAQVAIALANARLFEAAEKRAAELETLRQINLQITASLDFQVVLDAIIDGVFKLLSDLRAAHIFIYDGERLHFGAARLANGQHGKPIAHPRPNGLTYRVARTGERVIVDDMQTHELFIGVAEKNNWSGSMIGLPLKIGERVLGVMSVSRDRPNSFTKAELRILQLLGDQAAFLIENANLFAQMGTTLQHLSLLYDISRTLNSRLDVREILEQAAVMTCKALGGTLALVLEYQGSKKALQPRVAYLAEEDKFLPTASLGAISVSGQGVAVWVAQQRAPALIANTNDDPRWIDELPVDADATSVICAPILSNDKLIATLSVYHSQANAFSQDHLSLLQAICQQVALAYSNARRYQEINRLVDRLGAQQHRLESLIKELPVGLLLFDIDNHLLSSNDAGKVFWEQLNPQMKDGQLVSVAGYAVAELREHFNDPLPLEVSLDTPQRRRFELQTRRIIIGNTREWLLTIRDVTREREIQERIQMQDRLAVVGQLAAGIAHDFNNIMAAIVIYADLMQSDRTLSSTSKEHLTVIQRQVERASSLIRQILDFSRRSVMEQIELDLLPFVKEIEKLLQRILPETIQTEMAYDASEYLVFADPTRMQQVLMNLALNARDAMPTGGVLRFELKKLSFHPGDTMPSPYLTEGDWIRLSVMDTGIGIPPENLSRVFEPFFTTKGTGKGTGLGLAQVYGIVKQHGGVIDVHSQVGKGTTFHIYLPRQQSDPPFEDTPANTQSCDGQGRLVLLAEDDAAIRLAVSAMLEGSNFQVLTAINGVEALQILEDRDGAIDLLVTDLVMPQMSGDNLYHIIQDRWPGIKTLFITGHPLENSSDDLLTSGKVPWLQKPFSLNEFQHAIRELLEDRSDFKRTSPQGAARSPGTAPPQG